MLEVFIIILGKKKIHPENIFFTLLNKKRKKQLVLVFNYTRFIK